MHGLCISQTSGVSEDPTSDTDHLTIDLEDQTTLDCFLAFPEAKLAWAKSSLLAWIP